VFEVDLLLPGGKRLAIALVLLVNLGFVTCVNLLLPFWILLVSLDILINSLREGREPFATPKES